MPHGEDFLYLTPPLPPDPPDIEHHLEELKEKTKNLKIDIKMYLL
jgi:hypothetical protein